MVRLAIAAVRDRLLKHEAVELSLDLIGEAIGAEAITVDEIDELFLALENAGRSVGTATPNVREQLAVVLRHARQLHRANRATPDVAAIAHAAGLTPGEVRSALLYASVLSRER